MEVVDISVRGDQSARVPFSSSCPVGIGEGQLPGAYEAEAYP